MIEIDDLNITTRTRNALFKVGAKTIDDILSIKESELMRVENFGRGSLNDLKEALLDHGIKWGIQPKSIKKKALKLKPSTPLVKEILMLLISKGDHTDPNRILDLAFYYADQLIERSSE